MILKCKLGAVSFGYIKTEEIPATLEKDKEYTLEKDYDETMQVNYYKVIDEGKILTTISESEFKTFFEN